MPPPDSSCSREASGLAQASSGDEELVSRAQQGCKVSFDRLLRRFQSPVLQFFRRRGANSDAEDLLQETFLRVYKDLAGYRRRGSFAAWLFTIARRVSISHHRVARPESGNHSADGVASAAPEPWHAMAAEEDRRRLWALAQGILSVDEVTALWLYYTEDMPIADIARVLEKSRSAVKSMIFRARAKLSPFLSSPDGGTCHGRSNHRERPSSGS
jgi:RNA polymerase sigma-70 factor, ECF subfamily